MITLEGLLAQFKKFLESMSWLESQEKMNLVIRSLVPMLMSRIG
jgi:hypothetical protein